MRTKEVTIPKEAIQTIAKIIARGDSAKVKLDRGVVKVHAMKLKLEYSQEGEWLT